MSTHSLPRVDGATHPDTASVGLIVSAVPVPLLVADYAPIIDRFAGVDVKVIRDRLTTDEGLLKECLTLPKIVSASPAWTRLYGSPTSPDTPDLMGRHFTVTAYPDLHESMIRQFTAPFTGITSIVREHAAPTVKGTVTVRSHWQAPTLAGHPDYGRVVIVDLDVTDLRATQRHLEDSLDAKNRLVRSKDDLIASVSHEIRTPLAAIVGFVGVLNDAEDLSEADRSEMMNLLVQQSGDLTNIINDLLIVAKADQGKLEVARVSVDLRAQAAQVLQSWDSTRIQRLEVSNEPVRCVGDPSRVRQIVRNLVSNAVRYGGPEIGIDIGSLGRTGYLTVSDNGPGIPPEHRDRVFNAYERGNDLPGLTPALGLGLYISQTLAHLMDGELTYQYADGKSIFTLTLPLN